MMEPSVSVPESDPTTRTSSEPTIKEIAKALKERGLLKMKNGSWEIIDGPSGYLVDTGAAVSMTAQEGKTTVETVIIQFANGDISREKETVVKICSF